MSIQSLESQIKSDLYVTLEEISRVGVNNLNAKKVAQWLGQWIQAGDFQSRLEAVQSTFNEFTKSNFWAKLGIQDLKQLPDIFKSIIETQVSSLTQIHESGSALLLGEEPRDLEQLSAALKSIRGTSKGTDEASQGHMLLELSKIYQEVHTQLHTQESNLETVNGIKLIKPEILQQALKEKLNEHSNIFSQQFIDGCSAQIATLVEQGKSFHAPILRFNNHTNLIEILSSTDDGIKAKTDAELEKMITDENKAEAQKKAQKFIAEYCQPGITEYDKQAVQAEIKEAYGKLDGGTKAFLALRAREAQNIIQVRNQKHNSLSSLLGGFNVSSLIGSGILGLIAGAIFGNTKMGFLVTGLLSLLGSLDSKSTNSEAQAKAKLAPPAQRTRTDTTAATTSPA
jgi:hypothetical protein